MLELFLSTPESSGTINFDENVIRERIDLLEKLESVMWSVIISSGRNEARLWLCNSIASIRCINPRNQRQLFVELLRSESSKKEVAAQVLRLVFEKSPEKMGLIIAKKSYILEKFFEGNPKRILQWFDNFAGVGESGHKKGARALSQYAFVNRESCWEELEWKGRHGQSPAVVATKPHYFQDLDILQTVENFLEYVPEFWTSKELADVVKDGKILDLDRQFFVDEFLKFMYKEKLEDIWSVIEEFFTEEEFSFLAQHLLILLDEDSLLAFLNSVGKRLTATMQSKEFEHPAYWLEIVLSRCMESINLNQLYLLNAIINQGRQLLQILGEEEYQDKKEKVDEILKTFKSSSSSEHWALMKECRKMDWDVAIKWIALESWALHYLLSVDCKTHESWELLFKANGISHRKASQYSLMQSTQDDENYSDSESDGVSVKGHKRHKKRHKNRKRRYRDDYIYDLLEFRSSSGWQNPHQGSWFLSTDHYSSIWHVGDLPNYLSKYCFLVWMKWVFSVL